MVLSHDMFNDAGGTIYVVCYINSLSSLLPHHAKSNDDNNDKNVDKANILSFPSFSPSLYNNNDDLRVSLSTARKCKKRLQNILMIIKKKVAKIY